MSGSADLDGAETMPESTMPKAVADEHRASREIGGMSVFSEPNSGSLYGSASGEEQDAAEADGDADADAAPTRAELLEKIALLEQQAEKLLEITMLSQSNEKDAIERADEAEDHLLKNQRTWMITESTLRQKITSLELTKGPAVELDRQAGSGPSVPTARAEPKPGRPRRSKGGARQWRSGENTTRI